MNVHETRLVWDAITQRPTASLRELAEHTQLSRDAVQLAIYALETAGHIARAPGQARARTVLLPFRFQEKPVYDEY